MNFKLIEKTLKNISKSGKVVYGFKESLNTISESKLVVCSSTVSPDNLQLLEETCKKYSVPFTLTKNNSIVLSKFLGRSYRISVFSILNESTFAVGDHITKEFIDGYEKAWAKYLPKIGFSCLEDFIKEDVEQLFGPHDIVIRSIFKYKDTGVESQIMIPYTPIYTMSELSHKN